MEILNWPEATVAITIILGVFGLLSFIFYMAMRDVDSDKIETKEKIDEQK